MVASFLYNNGLRYGIGSVLIFSILLGISVSVNAAKDDALPDSLFEESLDAMRAADYHQANELIDEALTWYEKRNDTTGITRAYGYFSSSYRLKGDYDQARFYAQEAIRLGRHLDDPTLTIRPNNNLGIMYRRRGEYDKALEHYQQARDGVVINEDHDFNASLTMNIGHVYRARGELQKAFKAFREGLKIAEEHDLIYRKASAIGNLAGLYSNTGNYQQSLEMHKKRLDLLEETGNRHSRPNVLNSIGYNYRFLGEYDKALTYYRKASELASELGQLDLEVLSRNNIGQIYRQLDQFDRAISNFETNYKMLDQIESVSVRTSVLANYSRGLQFDGQIADALRYYHILLGEARERGNKLETAKRLRDLTDLYIRENNIDSSYHYASTYLETGLEANSPKDIVAAHQRLARVASLRDDLQLVRSHLTEISDMLDSPDLYTTEMKINFGKTVVDLLSTEDPMFFEGAEIYMDAVEQERQNIQVSAELRSSYFSEHVPRFKTIAKAYLEHGEVAEAFNTLERGRSRVLIEEIEHAFRAEQIPEEEHIRSQALRSQLTQLYEEIDFTFSADERDSLLSAIYEKQAEKQNLRASQLEKLDQHYSIAPASIKEVMQLTDPGTAVISYAVTDQHIMAFALFKDDYHTWKIDATKDQNFSHLLEQYREAIVDQHPLPVVNHYGWQIGQKLIEPAREIVEQADHLLISADGNLATLPFEALIWDGNYLINAVSVSTIPTLTALKLTKHHSTTSYPKDLLALANPAFAPQDIDDALALQGVQRSPAGRLDPLPASQIEAERISELFSNTRLLVRHEANKSNILNTDFSEFRFAHFATHGFIHREFPELSGLALSFGDGEAEYLRSREISSLSIPSEMVVLSACETAVGPEVTGEGMLGLQRAFLLAGTRSVVSSLWRVFDQSTVELMIHFYADLLDLENTQSGIFGFFNFSQNTRAESTRDKARALRSAKIRMINSTNYSHPVHWAAFTVTGY